MRITEILAKSRTSTVKIPKNNIDEFLSKKCPIAFNSPFKIYRGIRNERSLLYGNSKLFKRTSVNTKNYYTLLMDYILPKWKIYPKRSYSFICSSDMIDCSAYGKIYQVFPVGDPIIGICPDGDLWWSFEKSNNIDSLGEFSSLFYDLNVCFGTNFKDDLPILRSEIRKLDIRWKNYKLHPKNDLEFKYIFEIIDQYISSSNHYNSFTAVLDAMLDPNKNKFKVKKLSEIKNFPGNNEIWFSGPAYFKKL